MAKVYALIAFGTTASLVSASPLRPGQYGVHPRQLPPAVEIIWATSSTSSVSEDEMTISESVTSNGISSSLDIMPFEDPDTLQNPFLIMPPHITSLESEPSSSVTVSIVTEVQTISDTMVATSTVYEQPEVVTVTEAPTTVTSDFTVTETFIATPGSFWKAPKQFSDLSAFRIAHFACGQDNLQITDDIVLNDPSLDIGLGPAINGIDLESSFTQESKGTLDVKLNSTALQLYYPANSVNPGNFPQGGADFYATPIPLEDANNVTLEYSVFFPLGFDWVHGGKLPGLYGGHMTCSGGDAATSCFSTRLMWRAGGAGELYLYAPKDKQTVSLCHARPESVCDAAYGLSVSRGSFYFAPGVWTHVRQTVRLNTPGAQDGGFYLEIDGRPVIDRDDVFYRDIPVPETTSSSVQPSSTSGSESNNGGLLGPLLDNNPLLSVYPLAGGVLGPLGFHQGSLPPLGKLNGSYPYTNPYLTQPNSFLQSDTPISPSGALLVGETPCLGFSIDIDLTVTSTAISYNPTDTVPYPIYTLIAPQPAVTVTNYLWNNAFDREGKELDTSGTSRDGKTDGIKAKPIGFSGLFFSTFFGGSSEEYATPTDQYTWFKDFAIIINN